MASVERLLTTADTDDEDDPGPRARRMSVSARHEAILTDGRRVLLLDDRGWTATRHTAFLDGLPSEQERRRAEMAGPSVWQGQTKQDIEADARYVVGPDPPYGGRTQALMEEAHWDAMARILCEEGVVITIDDLKVLPHDVKLSHRILERIGLGRPDARP